MFNSPLWHREPPARSVEVKVADWKLDITGYPYIKMKDQTSGTTPARTLLM